MLSECLESAAQEPGQCAPKLLSRCPEAAEKVQLRFCAGSRTLLRICADTAAQLPRRYGTGLRRCMCPITAARVALSLLPRCFDAAAQVS